MAPTVFWTVSPPRNRFDKENGAPFGCRTASGFWIPRPSSSVIRLRAFWAALACAGAPGSTIDVGVNARVSPVSGLARTSSPKRS
jgi:hypothetical protein